MTETRINRLTGKPYTPQPYRRPELTAADIAYTDVVAVRCGYRDPPPELEPTGPMGEDPNWHALATWFRENLPAEPGIRSKGDFDSALLVYISRRWRTTIGEAYARTDSFMKSLHRGYEREEDPDAAWSYN